jgi:hypothetical protein
MHKFLPLGLAAFLALIFAFLLVPKGERTDSIFPASREESQGLAKGEEEGAITATSPTSGRPISPAKLVTASSGELFAVLFPVSRWSHWQESEVRKAAERRFSRPYPPQIRSHHKNLRERELVDRIGILKAMGRRGFRSSETYSFYRALVLSQEPLLVRRQALENLRPFLARAPERERAFLATLPPVLVSLAAQSEREILEQVLGAAAAGGRELSENAKSKNLWENLPCPSQGEFEALAQAVGWVGTAPYTCDLSHLGKFGRVLLLLSSMRLPVNPAAGEVGRNLEKPFEFVAARSRTMKFNFTQKDTVAFNRPSLAEIHLGAHFFTSGPLYSAAVLVHEARHSDRGEDSGHFICVQGDIPLTPGGCDRELTEKVDAGAYSYGVYFNMALAETAMVSAPDREYLITDALRVIGTRFNRLHPSLAHFQDAVAGLTESGKLVVLHPFAREALQPEGVASGERFQGISYHDSHGGLYLVGDQGKARSWRWGKAPEEFFPVVPAETNMRYVARLRIPYLERAYTIFLDDRNGVHYLDYNSETGERVMLPFSLKLPFSVKRFFLGARTRSYFLSEDGSLFRMRLWGSDEDFIPKHTDRRFRHATGGVLRDGMRGVGMDGLLYRQELKEIENGDDWPEYLPVLHRAEFQSPVPAVQYEEGTSSRALLDAEGAVWIAPHGSEAPMARLSGLKLRSFVFLKMLETRGPIRLAASPSEKFLQDCKVSQAGIEPWFKRGVGLADGHLIFEGDGFACLPAALPEGLQGRIASFTFKAGEFGSGNPSRFFAPVYLELGLTDGSRRSVRPYEGWR